jgi:hypothetical protein
MLTLPTLRAFTHRRLKLPAFLRRSSLLRAFRTRRTMAAAVAVVALTLSACFSDPPPQPSARDQIVYDHNTHRGFWGVHPLTPYVTGHWYSQATADRLRAQSGDGCSLSHTPGGQLQAWYPGRYVAENVACVWGCHSTWAATQVFMDSPPHGAQILNSGYNLIGVGVACNGNYLFVAVHLVS